MNRLLLVVSAVAGLGGCSKKTDGPAPAPTPAPTPKTVEPAPPKAPDSPDPKLVERGAYVAKLAGCVVCHTAIGPTGPDFEHAYGGGLEMPDTFGTWRTPNITPDKSTGIGSWTDDQVIAAVREGVRPDGKKLYPIMPYVNYNRMTDDDAKALVAFLHTVKPVSRVVAPTKDLKMAPIDVPKPANQPDVADDPVPHGEYLATLMLCSHCHFSPDPKTFAPQGPDKMFSGGLAMQLPMLGTGTLYSRNITSDKDTGIGKWTTAQIATAIKTMTKPDGKMIQGPMVFLQGPWSQLDDKDIQAVAEYIHQLPAVTNKVPDATFKPTAH
jgi:mono/diheme cytochrome c family protein